jgi:EAL domain-containing protein (putative c-di-GMP-specific phosphodiesterase class I)
VDELKIDRSFVTGLRDASSEDGVIVRSTIELGHNMGLRVVAEGVEDAATWRILESFGCDMAQGFLLSQGLPADQLEVWIRSSPWGRANGDTSGEAAERSARSS